MPKFDYECESEYEWIMILMNMNTSRKCTHMSLYSWISLLKCSGIYYPDIMYVCTIIYWYICNVRVQQNKSGDVFCTLLIYMTRYLSRTTDIIKTLVTQHSFSPNIPNSSHFIWFYANITERNECRWMKVGDTHLRRLSNHLSTTRRASRRKSREITYSELNIFLLLIKHITKYWKSLMHPFG